MQTTTAHMKRDADETKPEPAAKGDPRRSQLAWVGLVHAHLLACYSPNEPVAATRPGEDGTAVGELDSGTGASGSAAGTATGSGTEGAGSASEVGSGDGVSSDGAPPPVCGDGVLDDGESCDDGDRLNGNGCNNNCTESGVEYWTRIIDGGSSMVDSVDAVAVGPSGGVYFTGLADTPTGRVAWVRSHGPEGDENWTESFEVGGASGRGLGLSVTADERILVVASNDYASLAESVGELLTYGADGTILDTVALAALPSDVHVGLDGGFAVSGADLSALGGSRDYHAWTANYSSLGNERWSDVETDGLGGAEAVVVDGSGNVVVCASVGGSYWLRKFSAEGDRIWTRDFGPGEVRDLGTGPDDEVIAVGDDPTNAMWVASISGDGVIQWTDVVDEGQSTGVGVSVGPDASIVAVGRVMVIAFGHDALARKYTSDGDVLWSQHWDVLDGESSVIDTDAVGVTVDAQADIYVVGDVRQGGDPTLRDVWIRKISP